MKIHKNITSGLVLILTLTFALTPHSFNSRFLTRGNLSFEKQEALVADTVIFITSTASTTWTVPANWNDASNTIILNPKYYV